MSCDPGLTRELKELLTANFHKPLNHIIQFMCSMFQLSQGIRGSVGGNGPKGEKGDLGFVGDRGPTGRNGQAGNTVRLLWTLDLSVF